MITRWTVGLIFLLLGFAWLFFNLPIGMLIIITSTVLLPPHTKKIKNKFNIALGEKTAMAVYLALVVVILLFLY